MSGERTEQPTTKRRRESRQEGRIPKTPELSAWAGLLVATYVLRGAGAFAGRQVQQLWPDVERAAAAPDVQTAQRLLGQGLLASVLAVLPIALVLVGVGVAMNVAQGGIPFATKAARPKLERMNPKHALKRIFSSQGAWETAKSAVKVLVLGGLGWRAVRAIVEEAAAAGHLASWAVGARTLDVTLAFVREAALAGLVMAAVDYAVSRRRVGRSVRMTRQEVKDEAKQSEGDPHLKGQMRAMQRRAAQARSLDAVPRADAVVVNPTHIAVAIAYRTGSRAPEVLALGAGSAASRIRAVAEEHRVPIVQDVPLARTLFRLCDVGDPVPSELFEAVARILAFVYGLRRNGAARRRLDGAPHVVGSGPLVGSRS